MVAVVARALAEDLLPLGDLTAGLVPHDSRGRFVLVTRVPGVLAGMACARQTLAQVDPEIDFVAHGFDGDHVGPATPLATLEGSLRGILSAERTALNLLGHLSGVASLTRQYVEAVEAVTRRTRILDTRKTTPGLRALEKAAVRAGGGLNHRGSLSEGVLVKDNHLAGVSISEAVDRARSMWPGRMVEVECDHLHQVTEAVEAGATMVLLDNMTPLEVTECVAVVRSGSSPALVEVSGGISLDTVARYAACEPDFISVGALTHSAPVLDIGLDRRV
ncbi:MAG: carboxylating nicotinate-nucleotide diphosphorylase [Acidimicrobiales bacterium]